MEQQIIKVGGKSAYYVKSGKGRPLVLLHGMPTNSSLWEKMMPYLASKYSVYAFDLLGFGKSSRPDSSEIDIMSQAAFFMNVLKRLGLSDIVLVGHDIGGGIAQIITIRNKVKIKALILIDSVAYDSWPIEPLKTERKVEMVFEHLPDDVIRELFTRYISNGVFNKDKAGEVADKYWKCIEQPDGIPSFLKAVKSLDNGYTMEIAPLLYRIKVPTLILWGRHDPYIRLSYGLRLSEDIKNSKFEVIDEASHFLPEDQPERASKHILEFLDGMAPE